MYSMKTLVLCLLVCVTVCGTIRKPKPVVILKCCKNNEYLPLSGDNKCVQNDSSSWHIDIFNGRKGHFEMHTSLPEHWIIKEGMIPKCAKPKKLFFKSRSSIPFLNGSIYSVEYGKLLHPDQICIDYNAFLVCLNEPHNLIKKCCGENAIFSETNGTCRNFNDQSYKIDVGQNWTLGAGFPICTENKLHVVVGELHKSKIFDNGSLLVDNKIILSAGNFCLEHVLEHTGRSASVITCPEHLPPQPQPSRPQNETDLRFTIYPIGLAISVIFLAATLAAGALMPASHHVLHWRCQTNHVTCLLLGDVLLCVTHLSGRIDFWPCFMIGRPSLEPNVNERDPPQDPLTIEFVEVPSLDSEVLNVLGTDMPTGEILGDPVHKDIALRWETILMKGLDNEVKSKLIEKYPVIANCLALRPPKVNPEVKAAANEAALKRDVHLEKIQLQMGASLSALGQSLSILLKNEEGGGGNLHLVELINDAARLIADLHHEESKSRQTLISLNLDKSLKDSLVNTTLDGWLFGDNLTERLKSVKAIEKSGEGLKTTAQSKSGKTKKFSKNVKYPPRQVVALGGQKIRFRTKNPQQRFSGAQYRPHQGPTENLYRRRQYGESTREKEKKRERKP